MRVMSVGSRGFCGSKVSDGGASSMWIVIELVPVFGCPWGSAALFHAVHETVWTPSPLTVSPRAGYGVPLAWSTAQLMPPTPDGPALAVESTVTLWLTHKVGFGSFEVSSDTTTGSLSTLTVLDGAVTTPAAFTAYSWIGKYPLVGT